MGAASPICFNILKINDIWNYINIPIPDNFEFHFWDYGGQHLQHAVHEDFIFSGIVNICAKLPDIKDKEAVSGNEQWLEVQN